MGPQNIPLLDAGSCVLLLIDHQPQMAFGVQSIDRQLLISNVVGLAKAAKLFNVPTILTTIAAETFSGPLFPQIQAVFPQQEPIDRTTMNAWEDQRVVEAVKRTGRKKVIIAGLWTEICAAFPALTALADGYEVYVVTDACGDVSTVVHDMAMQRMIQKGVVPLTWMQLMLEWQRDWARQETYQPVLDIIEAHGGAYGLGLVYAHAMVTEPSQRAKKAA
ncbi:MAG: hydrolase [Chloroflexota bacterium]|nr:MAG: hydrolase [Chloroflexota bacterium]